MKKKRTKILPSGEDLVGQAMNALKVTSITPDNINLVRAKCEEIANKITTDYYRNNFRPILENLRGMDLSKDDKDDDVGKILEWITEKVPGIIKSASNARVRVAGNANEYLYRRLLEQAGLIYGKDFKKISGIGKDFEIIHKGAQEKLLQVEIKSLKVRERGARTGSERAVKSVLAGFFDAPSEFTWEQVTEMGNVFEAVYLPLDTLKLIDKAALHIKNSRGNALLRSNTKFADEMKEFVKEGKLP